VPSRTAHIVIAPGIGFRAASRAVKEYLTVRKIMGYLNGSAVVCRRLHPGSLQIFRAVPCPLASIEGEILLLRQPDHVESLVKVTVRNRFSRFGKELR